MGLILASASPRRHELLKQLVDDFIIMPADIDEDAMTTADPIETAEKLAFAKAVAATKGKPLQDPTVIGCDTVVALSEISDQDSGLRREVWVQFTKPVDHDDAVRILQSLRGRTHQVITGVAVLTPFSSTVGHCVTNVTFNDVSDQEIEDYVNTGEPMDKAGAYGAQGMGSFLVKELDGPFDNVVGLPLELTRQLLQVVGFTDFKLAP